MCYMRKRHGYIVHLNCIHEVSETNNSNISKFQLSKIFFLLECQIEVADQSTTNKSYRACMMYLWRNIGPHRIKSKQAMIVVNS
jgi:hypothetical protein